jgi:PTS system nitrogen regulatory IIA component
MRLSDFLDPALVVCDLQVKDSRDLLSQISERVCKLHPGLDKKVLLAKLKEREEKSSSGLECGVAVPHAMVPGVEKAICVAIRLAGNIDVQTVDGSMVCIVFALISPSDAVAAPGHSHGGQPACLREPVNSSCCSAWSRITGNGT